MRKVYVYHPPDPRELAKLNPEEMEKRMKEEKFKRRVAEFSQMMAQKAKEREMEELQKKNNIDLALDDKLKIQLDAQKILNLMKESKEGKHQNLNSKVKQQL